MLMRKDYMANSSNLHAAYYEEIATAAGVRISKDLLKRCRQSTDEHFNDIGLPVWDNAAASYDSSIGRAMKARGDSWSLAGGVCTMKASARAQL